MSEEIKRSREQKRREQGMIPREEYLAIAEQRKARVRELRRRYWAYGEIALDLGISKTRVAQICKQENI